jgi:hypothetical protein
MWLSVLQKGHRTEMVVCSGMGPVVLARIHFGERCRTLIRRGVPSVELASSANTDEARQYVHAQTQKRSYRTRTLAKRPTSGTPTKDR